MSTPVHILSLLSIVVTAIYLFLGFFVLRSNSRERLNQVFFLTCLCLSFWSFGYTFLPGAADKEAVWVWYKVSAVGWTVGPALLLHLTILLGRPELLKGRRWVFAAIYVPAAYFLLEAWTGSLGVVDFVNTPFGWSDVYGPATLPFIAYLIYFPLYILLGLGVVLVKGRETDLIAVKKQSRLIAATGVPLLILTGVSGILLPWLGIRVPPEISHLIVPVWVLAVWQALSIYSPMTLTPAVAGRDVLKTVADAVILVNRDHKIVGGNPAAEELFGQDEAQLHGRSIGDLIREMDPTAGSAVDDLLVDDDTESLELIFRGTAGEQVPVSLAASSVVDDFGQAAGAVLIIRDMTERQLAEESLKFVATHDALTGLPNRSILSDRLRQALKRAKREKKPFALLMFDLDEFKVLNDFYGHKVGDRVLQEVASILSRCVRGNDTVCRLGSDEFLIVVENLFESGDSDIVAERISSSLRRQLKVGEHTINVTGSIGISTFPFDGLDPETLMKKAHLALYSSKEKGRGVYQFYSPSMNTKNQERMAIENRLREAVDKDELLLQYQPLVELETGKIAGLEALCRWQSAEMGLVSPGTFIPIAERSGLIIPIGEWVVRTACLQNKRWQEEGLPAVPVAVNISARQLQQSDFVEMIELILDDTDLESHLLELELTESATMQNLDRSKRILGQLADLGVRIVIDDFGTGYSSLMRLKLLPMHAVKVDRSFIENIVDDPKDRALVMAIIAMARNLGVEVVAEGVETREQLEILSAIEWELPGIFRCDKLQGFLLSKPVHTQDVPNLFHWAEQPESPFQSLKQLVTGQEAAAESA